MSYERYTDWLEEAVDDYESAKDLMKLGRYGKACFFAQQASEKALKALMIKRVRAHVDIHSVAEILRRLKGAVEVPDELIAVGERLDRYYIPTRYPNAWGSAYIGVNKPMQALGYIRLSPHRGIALIPIRGNPRAPHPKV